MVHVSTPFKVILLLFVYYLAGFAKPGVAAPSVNADQSRQNDKYSACGEGGGLLRLSDLLFSNSNSTEEKREHTVQDFYVQQLLLTGFGRNDSVNRYNIRQGGFTSNSDNVVPPCIPVQYKFQCKNGGCQSLIDMPQCPEWVYMWTMFNAESLTGNILLRLTVYDLRVFGFELCDAYKTPVDISLNLELNNTILSKLHCQDICKALTDFTTLVSLTIL